VIFVATHDIKVPSTGKHISHSNTTSNDILIPLSIRPLEYETILVDPFLIYPSTKHFPSYLEAITVSIV